MKRNKSGISLIVLVITIIVMIILAAAVVIALDNSGIINKANEAVDENNLKQVQHLASLIWAEAYMNEDMKKEDITETYIREELGKQGVNTDAYDVVVEDNGVTVEKSKGPTLGSLIKGPEDYGKTIDYTVTVELAGEEKTYSDWQVYYSNEDYVYIILEESIPNIELNKGTTVASLTPDELALYEKFRVGTAEKYELVDTITENGYVSQMSNCQAVAQLIKDFSGFGATTESYSSYVEGAIGSPTIELLAAGWNSKGYEPTMVITTGRNGYYINGKEGINVTGDGLYVPSTYDVCWIASPSAYLDMSTDVLYFGQNFISHVDYLRDYSVRPVVCLSADIPAVVGTTTDYSLVK